MTSAVLDKLVYTAANPVLDHLVERVHHWPGFTGLIALLTGRTLRATRPLHFFRSDGPMPEALEITLAIPPELGPAAAVLSELRDRVRAVELERAAERLRTGSRVQGRRAVLTQSWRDQPTSYEPRRNLRPRIAAPNFAPTGFARQTQQLIADRLRNNREQSVRQLAGLNPGALL